jgi:hypothetical protein
LHTAVLRGDRCPGTSCSKFTAATRSAQAQAGVGKVRYAVIFRFFEDGEVTQVYASGLVVKVPLSDETVFLSAGRLDFAASRSDFRIVSDVGRSGNVAASCATLAP